MESGCWNIINTGKEGNISCLGKEVKIIDLNISERRLFKSEGARKNREIEEDFGNKGHGSDDLTKVMVMMTSDKSELFINTRKLVFHDKEGSLKNTWSTGTWVVEQVRPPALYLAQVKISVFWDWAPWWAPCQTSSALSRGSLLEDILTLPLLFSPLQKINQS